MGIKIKNLQTGEFEKFNIPALKGEKGEPGEIEPSEKVDYIGKQHSKLRDTMNANVDYIIKTAIGEFNYLDYEGQHITATNSIEGHTRSAILKGQTSFDVLNYEFLTGKYLNINNGTFIDGSSTHRYIEDYFAIPEGTQAITLKGENNYKKICYYDNNKQFIIGYQLQTQLLDDFTTDVPTGASYFRFNTSLTSSGSITSVNEYLHVYLDGFLCLTNKQSYTEGARLISCKMPVLTTTGKNLADFSKNLIVPFGKKEIINNQLRLYSEIAPNIWNMMTEYNFHCEVGDKISIQFKINKNENGKFNASVYDGNALKRSTTLNSGVVNGECKVSFVATTNNIKIEICPTYGNDYRLPYDVTIYDFQIEKGDMTQYKPYKSNILTVNEEVELRGIGDVKDELNLLTGELTQRLINMSNLGDYDMPNYIVHDLTDSSSVPVLKFSFNLPFKIVNTSYGATNNFPLACDKFKIRGDENGYSVDRGSYVSSRNNQLFLHLIKEEVGLPTDRSITKEIVKEFFKENPIEVTSQLVEPIVKTVDLSDNHVYSYGSTTHYSCSSEEGSLVPTLSVKVPTDTQLTIQEQKATTQTLLIKNMDLQQSIKEVQAMNLAFNTALYNSFNSIREEVEDIKKHVSTNENLEGSF